ncbi:DNA-binding MarR family transcriptional regulator [Nocardiopsis mwathae]|uniref:DNA-binding MarR family transcriptional regulator n=1 Tax=Nocardiopsis mwathae TaxID=1472723 RepID=A0A7W9YHR0_9ACTN|nr:MarR family transcriptional regulator [Nocardiopsis mwathae]MBB6171721.1 DNA-binding MarR family transcriptional regulator [Nocardiopsis mwathae]
MARRSSRYWLQHLDRIMDGGFERLLKSRGLTRRHWQIVHALRQEPLRAGELETRAAPFLDDEVASLAPDIDELRGLGWVRDTADGRLALTEEGERVHDGLWQQVQDHRARVTQDMSAEEYQATVNVLSRMARNAERR